MFALGKVIETLILLLVFDKVSAAFQNSPLMSEGNRLPVAAISGLRASSPTILSDSKTMNETYESLTDRLENIFKEPGRLSEGEQFWVAIAGGPGAGMSVKSSMD